MTDNAVSGAARGIFIYGPHPQIPGEQEAQRARVDWQQGPDGQVTAVLSGPCGEHRASAPTVFGALLQIRLEAEVAGGWRLMVHAARPDAWGGTDEHPCRGDQVLIYPEGSTKPDPTPVDALDCPKPLTLLRTASVREQLMRHDQRQAASPGRPAES